MLVGAGALVYWTIALGIGIPSLADVLGAPRSVQLPGHLRGAAYDTRCVTTASVDGRPVAFGDCFHVRFMQDSPELARPPLHTVPRTSPEIRRVAPAGDPLLAGPETEQDQDQQGVGAQPDPVDSVGRTAY
jgi:hypothetical protein